MILIIERIFVVLLVLMLVTQVVIPTFRGLPLFGWFRRRTTLDEKIEAARIQKAEAEKKLELAALQHDILDMEKRSEGVLAGSDICNSIKGVPDLPKPEPLITPAPTEQPTEQPTPETEPEEQK